MKLEFELSKRGTSKVVVWLVVGAIIGFLVATTVAPSFMGARCLTTSDLNRTDIGNTIVLTSRASRFCEGMGFVSAVKWQQDEQGNTIGIPVCIQQPQQ